MRNPSPGGHDWVTKGAWKDETTGEWHYQMKCLAHPGEWEYPPTEYEQKMLLWRSGQRCEEPKQAAGPA